MRLQSRQDALRQEVSRLMNWYLPVWPPLYLLLYPRYLFLCLPITLQEFGITLVSVILGWRIGLLGTLVYIFLGVVGLPIFANFRGGPSLLVDFTGGYIWSWPFMSILCGLHIKTSNKHRDTALLFLFSLAGLAVNEFLGGLQWALLAGNMTIKGVFLYSMTAFVPKDIVLTILAVIIGSQMHRLFLRAGFLSSPSASRR